MLYQIKNGTVSVGGQTVLSHIDFEIKGKEKIAIVGRNGAGKTTLLRFIAGELELDRDDKRQTPGVYCSRAVTVGILQQTRQYQTNQTVEEYLLGNFDEHERFLYEVECERLLTGLGLRKEDKKKKMEDCSGGEQTKIALIGLLVKKPDILLLDEPTNHLDLRAVEWLENYMKAYEGAAVMVSHDRFFLNQVVDTVYELQNGHLTCYSGNYTDYRLQKQKNLEIQKKKYESQQAEIERLKALIEQFKHKPKKAAFARSRRTILERMEKVEKPREDDAHIFTGTIEPLTPASKWVLEAEHLKIGYDKPLLELSLRVRRGQKIGIIGENGVGKSTFLKTVAGFMEPIDGSYTLGPHTMMGYFDQQTASLTSEKSVAEHFHDLFASMTEKEIRQTLGAYLFTGSDVSKRVSDLSGGEKSRLILCELLTGRPNLLVLDEPTNHMDIHAKETLESAFRAYTGTILFVSHDRYFINQVADAILVFEGNTVMYYPFGYEHYLKKSRESETQDIAAMIRAEDQAMVADLKAVPKAEHHQIREMNTEIAHMDWKLRLALEPMTEAKERVEMLYERYCRRQEEALQFYGEPYGDSLSSMQQELDAAWDEWTNTCLQWYDLFCEYFPPTESMLI